MEKQRGKNRFQNGEYRGTSSWHLKLDELTSSDRSEFDWQKSMFAFL